MTTLRQIRAYAAAVAERFNPDKIILFGSHAYGKPTADSDVDLMVLMRYSRGNVEGAIAIYQAVSVPFARDIIVCRPDSFARRVAAGESFLTS